MTGNSKVAMDVLTAIRGRRSVRSYAAGKPDEKTVCFLLEAAVQAPTAVHEEPWVFAVLQDPDTLKRLADRAKVSYEEEARRILRETGVRIPDRYADPAFDIFHNAGTLLVICGTSTGRFVAADCWLAAENLMLAAHSIGLGTCVIGSAVQPLNAPETMAELGIPESVTAYVPIVVGVPKGETAPVSRRPPEILVWK